MWTLPASEVNKLSRDGKLRVREIGSDQVSMLKAHEEALRGQDMGFLWFPDRWA